MRSLFFNLICILILILIGTQMFVLKYQVKDAEQELFSLYRRIEKDRLDVHILKAEWAVLNSPVELRKLVNQQTDLTVITPKQIIAPDNFFNPAEKDTEDVP